ncbi:MAG: hypothetical protein JWQ00_520 [Noviherbaspirillum sp.]|nr:hypothetical protein [Noviherbaspirillum sp.]
MRSIARTLLPFCVMASSSVTCASELALYSGISYTTGTEATYSWALEYRRAFAERWSGSFTWLNEGHIPDHHRDGHAAQLWWHANGQQAPSLRPSFRVGLGPYHYYDTRRASNSRAYADAHGWGLLASAEAIWHINENLFATVRANRVQTRGAGNSTALLAGIGYRFAPTSDRKDDGYPGAATASMRRLEVDVLAGKAIVNSFESETDTAAALALRYRATRNVTGSFSYIDEGAGRRGEARQGVAAQVWLEDDLGKRISVGAGIGPYFLIDRARRADGTLPSKVAAVISVTGAYAITDALAARLIWNRVATKDDSDSDVVLVGVGYRF